MVPVLFSRESLDMHGKRDCACPLPGMRIPPDRTFIISVYLGMQVLSLPGGLPCAALPWKAGKTRCMEG
jgi:hypothetical protein